MTTSRLRATKHVPRISPYSPASIDPGFVDIGLVRLSQSVKQQMLHIHTRTDRQTDKQIDREAGRQTDEQADRHTHIHAHTHTRTHAHTRARRKQGML